MSRLPLLAFACVLVVSGCARAALPLQPIPVPDASAAYTEWHETALARWVANDLAGADAAFQRSVQNRSAGDSPELLVAILVDWAELSLARGDGAAVPARLASAQTALQQARAIGQMGDSDLAAYGRLIQTLDAASLQDRTSSAQAIAALRALGPSPWGADDQLFLGRLLAEQGQVEPARAAYAAYLEAAPRLSLLRRGGDARREASAFLAASAR